MASMDRCGTVTPSVSNLAVHVTSANATAMGSRAQQQLQSAADCRTWQQCPALLNRPNDAQQGCAVLDLVVQL